MSLYARTGGRQSGENEGSTSRENHPEEADAWQEGGAKLTLTPPNEWYEDIQTSENDAKGQERDAEGEKPVSDKAAPPQLQIRLALIGARDATDTGSNNLLLDNNQEDFSPQLFDLCGRLYSVIDLLDFPNTESNQLNDGIHAFLLLVPNGLHVKHYNSGLQWLEKTFGKESFQFLITIVTHESNEECENSTADLKDVGGFGEKRYHTCLRSMADVDDIVELLEKIDSLVSDNSHRCFGGITVGHNKDKEQRNKKSPNKENVDSSALLNSGDEQMKSCTEGKSDESEDGEESVKTAGFKPKKHNPEEGDEPEKSFMASEEKSGEFHDVEDSVNTDTPAASGHEGGSGQRIAMFPAGPTNTTSARRQISAEMDT